MIGRRRTHGEAARDNGARAARGFAAEGRARGLVRVIIVELIIGVVVSHKVGELVTLVRHGGRVKMQSRAEEKASP